MFTRTTENLLCYMTDRAGSKVSIDDVKIPENAAERLNHLKECWFSALRALDRRDRRVLFLVRGIDTLDAADPLWWLPTERYANIRFILSGTEMPVCTQELAELTKRYYFQNADVFSRENYLDAYMNHHHKQLSDSIRKELLAASEGRHPQYMEFLKQNGMENAGEVYFGYDTEVQDMLTEQSWSDQVRIINSLLESLYQERGETEKAQTLHDEVTEMTRMLDPVIKSGQGSIGDCVTVIYPDSNGPRTYKPDYRRNTAIVLAKEGRRFKEQGKDWEALQKFEESTRMLLQIYEDGKTGSIKGIADTLRNLRSDQHTLQVFLQLLLKGNGCGIAVPRHKILEIPEYFLKSVIQSGIEHDGQYRDMLLIGKRQDFPDSTVLFKKEPCAHGHDDQLHVGKPTGQILPGHRILFRILLIKEGNILEGVHHVHNFPEVTLEVFRMAGKEDTGKAFGVLLTAGVEGNFIFIIFSRGRQDFFFNLRLQVFSLRSLILCR